MSNSRRPAGRSFNPSWLLLLLIPVALLAGRYLGDRPAPAAPAGGQPAAAVTGAVQWVPVDQALEQAKRDNKVVMFDFNADWCPPCQRMKHEVFEHPAYARRIQAAVVPVSVVDRYRETGTNPADIAELQERFKIEAFPTLVVMSPATGRYVMQAGYGGQDYTAQWIEAAARQVQ